MAGALNQIERVSQSVLGGKTESFIAELQGHIAATLMDVAGVDDEVAANVSQKVCTHLATTLGGQLIYIGKGYATIKRDEQIYAAWSKGTPYLELAREYGLTESRVRQIVEGFDAEERRRRQPDLPGIEG